ncbi:MAG: DUF2834 domain-containing protein [Polyangiales bacterium]
MEDRSRSRSLLALAVLVPFFTFSVWVSLHHGWLGFIDTAIQGGWETQIFLDLVIALVVASTVVVRDARRRGLRAWPWLVATALLGSIGMLGYFVYRAVPGVGRAPAPEA